MGEERSASTAPKPFVVVFTRRSGSTWLCDMLGSHPDVTCYGELFTPVGSQGQPPLRGDLPYFFDTVRHRTRLALGSPIRGWRYADGLFRRRAREHAVGCKVGYSHFKHVPWLLAYIVLRRVAVVHLVRRNKLAHLLSIESANARGKYHALVGERVDNPPVRLEPKTLVASLDYEERLVRKARRILSLLPVRVLEVAYEDLLESPELFSAVLGFIGVDAGGHELRTKLQKWNRSTLKEAIANYDDVKRALTGTRYLELLEAPGGAA